MKILFWFLIACLFWGCTQNTNNTGEWYDARIGHCTLKLPHNYSIVYFSEDSAAGKINMGANSSADFATGYIVAAIIDKQEGKVLSSDTVKSYLTKTILFSSAKNNNNIGFYARDTTRSTTVFGEKRVMGVMIIADSVKKNEVDTLLKVFKTVRPKNHVKAKKPNNVI